MYIYKIETFAIFCNTMRRKVKKNHAGHFYHSLRLLRWMMKGDNWNKLTAATCSINTLKMAQSFCLWIFVALFFLLFSCFLKLFGFYNKAVLNRNLHSAAGQRKLSPEEEYARRDLIRTSLGAQCMGRIPLNPLILWIMIHIIIRDFILSPWMSWYALIFDLLDVNVWSVDLI